MNDFSARIKQGGTEQKHQPSKTKEGAMKRMVRLLGMVLAVMTTFGIFIPESEARWSSNNRRAVVLEAFYALRPSHDGGCDKTISGNCVSNWNYINSDPSAYEVVRGWYSCNSSIWTRANDGSSCYNNNYPVSFWANYAYDYGYYGNYGRGGQCRYFANLILYRSGSYQTALPSYSDMTNNPGNYESDMQKAKEGDVLITLNEGTGYNIMHTAIVVEIKRSGTTVTGLDTIDANWVSDNGQSGREVIGRHLLSISYLQQHSYRIWKNISYYNEPYIP